MIRLPPELLRTLLETRVVRGSILRFWWDTAGKHKFGIVLNAAWPESGVLLVITTSKLAFYDRVDLGGDIVRIAAGAYPCFPKDTVINLREIIEVTIDDLVARGDFEIAASLSGENLAEIDRKVEASALISRKLKRRILGR